MISFPRSDSSCYVLRKNEAAQPDRRMYAKNRLPRPRSVACTTEHLAASGRLGEGWRRPWTAQSWPSRLSAEYIHARTDTHARTHRHARTHARTHTHTHTHTHWGYRFFIPLQHCWYAQLSSLFRWLQKIWTLPGTPSHQSCSFRDITSEKVAALLAVYYESVASVLECKYCTSYLHEI